MNAARHAPATRIPSPPRSAKIVIAGGFGAGKTTLVGAISEIVPLTTEAAMTSLGIGVDDASAVETKTTTTVALDFGRITIDERLVLYLFGTPGQDRFAFMWDDIARGALGAIVLVDTRRLEECYPAIDYFEQRKIPVVIAINRFPGAPEADTARNTHLTALRPADVVVQPSDVVSMRSDSMRARWRTTAFLSTSSSVRWTRCGRRMPTARTPGTTSG